MPLPLLGQILISVALQVVGYVLMPKPKAEQPQETKEFEGPTVEAGRPIIVVFGDEEITEGQWLYTGEKRTEEVEL